MRGTEIFLPFLAMMLLTLGVWSYMYVRRTSYLVSERVDLRKVDSPVKMDQQVPADINLPAYALRNLFELPVIFYALCLFLYATDTVDVFYISAAWVFVIGRAAHSIIYCTYNRVMHRFIAYFLSALVLWSMVLRSTFQILASPAT